jgi:hypothetical protein
LAKVASYTTIWASTTRLTISRLVPANCDPANTSTYRGACQIPHKFLMLQELLYI